MSKARTPLSSVVVVGAGQVGVLAAIAVKRAVPGCDVAVIAHRGDPRDFADNAASALPFANRLHERLGIEDAAIVSKAGGSHRLIERYFGWGGEGQHGAVPYGEAPALGAYAFGREWGGGSRSVSERQVQGSLAEVLADAGRFRVAGHSENTALAKVEFALRWNPAAFRHLLIQHAQKLGISYREAPLKQVRLAESGDIAEIELASQEVLTADLYLDCSGVSRQVVSYLPGGEVVPWTGDERAQSVIVAAPGEPMVALEDRLSLTPHGWLREFAGRDGLQQIAGIPAHLAPERACEALGLQLVAQISCQPAALAQCWIGNTIAIGDAAAEFEPIGNHHLDLAHRMITLLLELLPGATIAASERAEYNRRACLMIDGVRETLALHYAAPVARGIFHTCQLSPRVETTIDQFSRRGRLPFFDEQPLTSSEKQALMRALGFDEGIPPQHRVAIPGREEQRRAFLAQARAMLAETPPYAQWLGSQLRG